MYKLNAYGVTRISDNALVPLDPENSDYVEYLDWEAQGNVAEPADPPTIAEQNADIESQIHTLERGQSRAVREAAIGIAGAVDRLKTLDAKIVNLRSQLK